MTGTLRYSPKLLGKKQSSKWWVVLDCDPAIGKYYRHLYKLKYHYCKSLLRPAWKEHITVVRDEEPPKKHLWEKYAGEEIGFEISHEIHTNGLHFWLPVQSGRLLDIREELGLTRNPSAAFHLTIGNCHEDEKTALAEVNRVE
jgi:hypothetical protein